MGHLPNQPSLRLYEPTSKHDYAKRAYVKTHFKTKELALAIYTQATEHHLAERLVIMESSILDIIQDEHCRVGHAGVHGTWAGC